MTVADELTKELAKTRLGSLADLLEKQGVAIEDIGKIRSVGFVEGDYQAIARDPDGEIRVHDLQKHATTISFSPAWEEGPKWPVVQQGAPVKVTPRKASATWESETIKRAFILPDVQIGFRRYEDGTMDPFHDERAIDVALQAMYDYDPHVVILVGDVLDFAEASTKFTQEPSFAQTTQAAIDRGTELLAQVKANCREGTIVIFMEGNHDRRIQNFITDNAKFALYLKKGNSTPEDWPVLSVPYLLRMDELGVTYHGGYPANRYFINDRLCVIHGSKVRSGGSTASAVVDDERVSTIFGHIHRIEEKYKTRHTRNGPRHTLAATSGCLCRIDGAVPSTKGSTDPLGRPLFSAEDWQNGLGTVEYEEGEGWFDYNSYLIVEGRMRFNGKTYNSTVDLYRNSLDG